MNPDALTTQKRISLAEAIQLFQSGAAEVAMDICNRLLTRNPNQPEVLHLLGLIELKGGRFSEAHSLLAQALSFCPEQAEFHNDMGLVCMEMGNYESALSSFRAAITLQPKMVMAHYNSGLCHKLSGDDLSAAQAFVSALRYDPNNAKAHFSLGELLLARLEFQGAERHFQAAIKSNPDYVAAYNHLAISLGEQERGDEARRLLQKALEVDPLCASTHCNLGNIAKQSYDFKEAIRCYREAMRLQPDFIEAHFNLSVVLLLLEDLESGWTEYEWRLRFFAADSGYPNRRGLPLWQSQSLKGKTILVYDEQGFGDVLMFCRFLPMLKARGARVVFETRPALFDLLRELPYIDETILRHSEHLPSTRCDYCVPLLSLPGRFGIDRNSIRFDTPYLFVNPQNAEQWRRKMPGEGLKVGLVWQGSNFDRTRRWVDLDILSRLSHLEGIQWYGLQKELSPLSNTQDDWLIQLGADFNDFSDTAAAIANLDLVITIDTAVAHLAGAMGKQVWVLLPLVPDWRWFLNSETTPWYAGMRLYRQHSAGDWNKPLTDVANDLKQWVDRQNRCQSNESIQSLHATAVEQHRRQAFPEAESLYRELLAHAPEHHGASASLGLLYLQVGRYDDAVKALKQTMLLKPDDALSMNNLGLAFHRLGHLERAILAFFSAIAAHPEYANTYHNLGNVFLELKQLDDTIAWYKKALDFHPNDARAQCEMGKLLLKKLDLTGARSHFEQSVNLSPDDTEARISIATTALLQGDFITGWFNFQWRFKSKGMRNRTYPHLYTLPRWQGEPFPGRRLLVHCEQGFGDTIQFSRFLPHAKALGGEVTFQLQTPLLPLFRTFPGVDRIELLTDDQAEGSDHDLYVPLLDLPMCLETTVETIPATVPYLSPEHGRIHQWRQDINGDLLKIGMVWAGNQQHNNDRNRSCPIEKMLSIGEVDWVKRYSLQKEMSDNDHDIIVNRTDITPVGDRLTDFGETAAAIACLDLIITVDTAIAHLSGAMGKPTWVLLPYLPDWRWMTVRNDSPWYPTIRLFRQPQPGDWDSVMRAVRIALCEELDSV